ncbi:MAG: GT2 family glycosyltransferase [Verrucomicrobiales bacterium]|jgi:GT2 family glycosyltransferase
MLPAKNADSTLESAARSCLNQTFEDLELILIENDSSPGTRSVMEQLRSEDERVRLISAPPGAGFIAALNIGWQDANGELLARMDADDLCAPERIERQVSFLDQHSEVAACGTLVRIRRRDQEGSVQPAFEGYALFEQWLNSVVLESAIAAERFIDSPIANPSAMIRRSVFDQIGGYREVAWAEDYDFWLRMLDAGLRIGKVDQQLLDWFDSESRLTRNDEHYGQDRFLEAKAHFLARLPQVRERGVAISGAGPIGKRLGRLLISKGVRLIAFLEVSPRRIGNEIDGVPILRDTELPLEGRPILIGAVGLRGARQKIRNLVEPLGYIEGSDFFCVA